ncbi:MAG: glycosyltransferase family 4 protein [Patescibacteria group bacterium]
MHIPEFPKGKVLLITVDYPPKVGGVAWYYYNLVRILNTDDVHTVKVMSLVKWMLTPLWPFLIISLLLKTITLKPDYWWVGQVLPVGTIVWLLSFFWHKPYIVSTHGMDVLVPFKSPRKQWLVGKILNRAALITANSEWTKQKIIENYFLKYKEQDTRNKIMVIYPEPKPKREVIHEEIDVLRARLRIPVGAKVLLTVSRLVARKGIDRVMRALPYVWASMPLLHYVVVGEGEEKTLLYNLRSQFPKHDKEKIHFIGRVGENELAVYYAICDAFVLLPRERGSDVEGFCIVYTEANQYGMPIIGCLSGGTKEALSLCERVYTVNNPDNPIEVAQRICQAFQ